MPLSAPQSHHENARSLLRFLADRIRAFESPHCNPVTGQRLQRTRAVVVLLSLAPKCCFNFNILERMIFKKLIASFGHIWNCWDFGRFDSSPIYIRPFRLLQRCWTFIGGLAMSGKQTTCMLQESIEKVVESLINVEDRVCFVLAVKFLLSPRTLKRSQWTIYLVDIGSGSGLLTNGCSTESAVRSSFGRLLLMGSISMVHRWRFLAKIKRSGEHQGFEQNI